MDIEPVIVGFGSIGGNGPRLGNSGTRSTLSAAIREGFVGPVSFYWNRQNSGLGGVEVLCAGLMAFGPHAAWEKAAHLRELSAGPSGTGAAGGLSSVPADERES
jgi:hypothetical protein